jgi:hypothetical protein
MRHRRKHSLRRRYGHAHGSQYPTQPMPAMTSRQIVDYDKWVRADEERKARRRRAPSPEVRLPRKVRGKIKR